MVADAGLGADVVPHVMRHTCATWLKLKRIWQGRFYSTALDEGHLLAAIRYVTLNPVKAALVDPAPVNGGYVRAACDWPWSSARAHAAAKNDGVVDVEPLLKRVGSFEAFLAGWNPKRHWRYAELREAAAPLATTRRSERRRRERGRGTALEHSHLEPFRAVSRPGP